MSKIPDGLMTFFVVRVHGADYAVTGPFLSLHSAQSWAIIRRGEGGAAYHVKWGEVPYLGKDPNPKLRTVTWSMR